MTWVENDLCVVVVVVGRMWAEGEFMLVERLNGIIFVCAIGTRQRRHSHGRGGTFLMLIKWVCNEVQKMDVEGN